MSLVLPLFGPKAEAQTATFDFDTGVPALAVGQGLPVDQSAGGVSAHFSTAANSGAMSVQSDASTQFHLSQMSGRYLAPTSVNPSILEISFTPAVATISLKFATVDYQDNLETPSTIQLSAQANTAVVGTATARAAYGTDTYPAGTLSFSSAQPFNSVRIEVPPQLSSLRTFIVDSITVTSSAAAQAPPLAIALKDTKHVRIAWPAASTGFVLEQNDAIDNSTWVTSTDMVSVVGNENQVVVLVAALTHYYRLRHP